MKGVSYLLPYLLKAISILQKNPAAFVHKNVYDYFLKLV